MLVNPYKNISMYLAIVCPPLKDAPAVSRFLVNQAKPRIQ
jgi:hypothetical protein